jgi:hypothetical protein
MQKAWTNHKLVSNRSDPNPSRDCSMLFAFAFARNTLAHFVMADDVRCTHGEPYFLDSAPYDTAINLCQALNSGGGGGGGSGVGDGSGGGGDQPGRVPR